MSFYERRLNLRKHRALTKNITLINATQNNANKRTYNIAIGQVKHIVIIKNKPECTCSDFIQNCIKCTHIYFILLKVLQTDIDKDLYSDAELIQIFQQNPLSKKKHNNKQYKQYKQKQHKQHNQQKQQNVQIVQNIQTQHVQNIQPIINNNNDNNDGNKIITNNNANSIHNSVNNSDNSVNNSINTNNITCDENDEFTVKLLYPNANINDIIIETHMDNQKMYDKIILENIIENTFHVIPIVNDPVTTIYNYIETTYDITTKQNANDLYDNGIPITSITRNDDFFGVYITKVSNNTYELYLKEKIKINNGIIFNNYVDSIQISKIAKFILAN